MWTIFLPSGLWSTYRYKMTTRSNFGLYNSGTYLPFACDIEAVTQSTNAVITTSVDHGFIVGNQVYFQIPPEYGMTQLNGRKGFVLDFTDDTITVDINSSNFNAFVIPTLPSPIVVIDPAQVLPAGDYNFGYSVPGGEEPPLEIPGAYRNTYP